MACSHTCMCMVVSRHSLQSTHVCCCVAWHHTPLPCRWKKQGHWWLESNRRTEEGGVKKRCCLAHRGDGWYWLCPRCQRASVHRSGGGGFWQRTSAAASCPHRHEEEGGGGGRGGVLLCDKVRFKWCYQHPCSPCGSSLTSKCSLLVCWEWERGGERERGPKAAHHVGEW